MAAAQFAKVAKVVHFLPLKLNRDRHGRLNFYDHEEDAGM